MEFRNETEKKTHSIWCEVLNNPDIQLEDNFFDIGGNSLYAMLMLKKIEEVFQVEFEVADLFACKNVKETAEAIDKILYEHKGKA
ncbi:MAG: acyl carrier protein [Lachnospiraceae bacterium]|nr:acyl carrier protein [Lachnospiraceae bacterium]